MSEVREIPQHDVLRVPRLPLFAVPRETDGKKVALKGERSGQDSRPWQGLAKSEAIYDFARMIERQLEPLVLSRLAQFPCVAILGPRQVGKTTLARAIVDRLPGASIYLDLENPADRRRLDDPAAYLAAQADKLVVLDEIHRAPALFEVLRGQIDERRRR